MDLGNDPHAAVPHSGFAEVNGTRLYYERSGSGHPLVLVAGTGFDTRLWDDQFPSFSQHYHTVRYDLRGMGKSSVPPAGTYAHEEDLKSLLDHLDIDRAHVLGLSYGGGIVLGFAVAYPESTSSVIAVSPSAALIGFRWSDEISGWLTSVRSAGSEDGPEAAKDVWLGLPWLSHALEKPNAASRLTRIVSDYSGWHFVNHDPVRVPDPPIIQRLEEIRAPTLVIVGELDTPDNHAIADTLLGIPNSRKVVMPGIGHMANMEDPEGFNETVVSFLADVTSSA